MDWEVAEMVARKAFDIIKNDEELWKLWNEAKEPKERDLLMVHAVWKHTFDYAYGMGYDEGHADGGYDMRNHIEREGI